MALISLTKDFQAWKIGDYVALNNVWGKGSLVNGIDFTQSVLVANPTLNSGVTFNWNWPTSGPYGVSAYPEISWGDSPLYDGPEETHSYVSRISDLKAFNVNLDISVAAASQYLNVSFDIWLTNKPLGNEASITTEVMVWLDSKAAPWGQKVTTIGTGNDTASVYYVVDAKTGTRVWDYVAVVYDKPHLSGNIDLKAIMNMLSVKGLIDSHDYVSGYNIGSEIISGKGSLQINKLETVFQTGSTDPTSGGTIPLDHVITGTAGNDTLVGSNANDAISGGLGNDIIEGGAGRDILDGGDGVDTVTYASSNAGVTIDLATNTATGGHATGDVIRGFENVTGSAFADILSGDASDNVISGLDGDDVIEGGAGNDSLWGGDGNDTLEYRRSNAAVAIDLTLGTASGGHAAGDTFSNFENVTGSRYNDSLIGSDGANTIYGLDGDDKIDGRAGNDIIDGGDGNDKLAGGDGNDTISGGLGNDVIEGGAGRDTLDGGAGMDTVTYASSDAGVIIDLATNTATGGHATGDVIRGFENVTGSAFADILSGDASANVIYGLDGNDRILAGDGNDTVSGGNGDDVVEGGAGSDILFGGDGNDTLEYRSSNAAVAIDLTLLTASGGHAAGDTFANFENVTGSSYNDSLIGTNGGNTINGLDGDDTIDGRGGNDTIYGGAGSDTISGGTANDIIDGGEGNDVISGDSGADTLWGGQGADRFLFRNGDSTLNSMDTIKDINFGEGDRIDLTGLDGNTVSQGFQSLVFVGAAGFTGHAGELRYRTTSAGTLISADTNGDGVADFVVQLNYQEAVTRDFFIL